MKKLKKIFLIFFSFMFVLNFSFSQDIKVQYSCTESNDVTNQIRFIINIQNESSISVNMDQLKTRYYFTLEQAADLQFHCDHAQIGSSNVSGTFNQIEGDSYYLEISFSGSYVIPSGGSSGEVQIRFNKSNWTNFTQSNDYSFDASITSFTDFEKITLHQDDSLIWGIPVSDEPDDPEDPTDPTDDPIDPNGNLITNNSFEEGITDWYPYGECLITAVTEEAYTGSASVLVSERTQDWNGVAQNLLNKMQIGETYTVTCWVKLKNSASESIKITIHKADGNGDEYTPVSQKDVTDQDWIKLTGSYTLDPVGTLETLEVYIENAPVGVEYYVDDVEVIIQTESSWLDEANGRIENIRKRDAVITIVDADGNPLDDITLDISQEKHYFGFGCALAENMKSDETYANWFKDHFEWAVFENEAKWYHTESTQGVEDYSDPDAMYEFCEENDIKVRGHCVFWAVQDYVQGWVQSLNNTDLQAAIDNRLDSVVSRYKGKFLHWDVNNEMLHGSFFMDKLGASIRPYMFQKTYEIDPDCKLFVNDYNVVSYMETDAYVAQINDLIANGAPIHGIGAQCHFNENDIDHVAILDRLDTLAQLDLPIWASEFDVVDSDVNSRADKIEKFMRLAFSHPGVEGIMLWGFWAGRHWMGDEAALVDIDWTVNAAGQRYLDLMAEWTTSDSGITTNGSYSYRGFHGRYKIVLTSGNETVTKYIELIPGDSTAEYTLVFDNTQQVYTLDVTGGTGSGTYEAGTTVNISWTEPDLEPDERAAFQEWTGDTDYIADINDPNTTVTIPTADIAVEAVYTIETVQVYALNVTSGTGSGYYEEGEIVNISWTEPEVNSGEIAVFQGWIGDTTYVADVNNPDTTVTIPSLDISLEASYTIEEIIGEAISIPFTQNGVGEFYWVLDQIPNYINSWNLDLLEVNGIDVTNTWKNGTDLPPMQDGYYYIHYIGQYGWSHFEIR